MHLRLRADIASVRNGRYMRVWSMTAPGRMPHWLRRGSALGPRGQRIELAGRAAGKNRCNARLPIDCKPLVIGVPQFAATAASLALPGRELRVAALDAIGRRMSSHAGAS